MVFVTKADSHNELEESLFLFQFEWTRLAGWVRYG